MEEASFDHGTDRLRFFFLLFALAFSPHALATTFGPISVTKQIQNATYVVHGRIVGSSWVVEERQSRRPYTHWKLQVMEQPKGENLPGEVTIRQPGGELGGLGYHVAGTAQFRGGEEVFVNLRETDEPGILEVMALASGKYTVEKGADGKSTLRSGLGFVLRDEKGTAYTPEAFVALAKRIAEGRETEADQSVFVTKGLTHDETTAPVPPETKAAIHAQVKAESSSQTAPNPLEESSPQTEELKGSSVWWIVLLGSLVAAFSGFLWFKKR